MEHTYESLSKETNGFTISRLFHKVKVTPIMATGFKKHNNRNRPYKHSAITKYTKDMREGNFIHIGDTIRFDQNGSIIDGQNRIESILNSGVTVEQNIETGLPVLAFEKIDQGIKRSFGDMIFGMGIRYHQTVASGIVLYHGLLDITSKEKKKSIPNAKLVEYVKNNVKMVPLMEDCAALAKKYKKALEGSVSEYMYMAILYMARKKYGDKAIEFFDKLSQGNFVQTSQTDIFALLWNKVYKSSPGATKMDRHFRVAYIVKAFNIWMAKKRVSRLTWSSDEDFPIIE